MSSSTAIGACHDATFVISLPSRHSLFASYQSLPFSARQGLCPTIHPVPRPVSLVPFCFRPASHAPRPILFPFPVPCPAQGG